MSPPTHALFSQALVAENSWEKLMLTNILLKRSQLTSDVISCRFVQLLLYLSLISFATLLHFWINFHHLQQSMEKRTKWIFSSKMNALINVWQLVLALYLQKDDLNFLKWRFCSESVRSPLNTAYFNTFDILTSQHDVLRRKWKIFQRALN